MAASLDPLFWGLIAFATAQKLRCVLIANGFILNLCTMSHSDVIAARFLAFDQMYSYERRLETFADWPFREDCQCTPELVSSDNAAHWAASE